MQGVIMFSKASIGMTVKKYTNYISADKITFDNVYQRGLVWNNARKSLLIHTLLLDYPVPTIYAIEKENGYDILDGQQRSVALFEYRNNKFKLSNVPDIEYEDLNGNFEVANINGKKYTELPEELRDRIDDYVLDIICFKNITEDEIRELFYRLNNGMTLSSSDLARAKNKDMETIKELSKHKLFTTLFTPQRLLKKPQDEIVVKTWMALNERGVDYSGKHYNALMGNLMISEEEKAKIINVFDIVYEGLKIVQIVDKAIFNIVKKKLHFLSYVRFIDKFQTHQQFAEWAVKFYSDIPKEYYDATQKHTATIKSIKERMDTVEKSIDDFLTNIDK